MQHNYSRPILVSEARTATVSQEVEDKRAKGAQIIIDVTSVTLTPSITPSIEGYDPLSGSWYTILTGAAITTVSTTMISVYPGIGETANVSESQFLPAKWRVTISHIDTDSITYSVGANIRTE